MKCITLTQPYASLMAWGLKGKETRSWALPIKYKGERMGIHAGVGLKPVGNRRGMIKLCTAPFFRKALDQRGIWPFTAVDHMVYGAIVGTVVFTDVVKITAITPVPHIVPGLVHIMGMSAWYNKEESYLFKPAEIAFGLYEVGRYFWVTEPDATICLKRPIIVSGHQSIWNYEGAV